MFCVLSIAMYQMLSDLSTAALKSREWTTREWRSMSSDQTRWHLNAYCFSNGSLRYICVKLIPSWTHYVHLSRIFTYACVCWQILTATDNVLLQVYVYECVCQEFCFLITIHTIFKLWRVVVIICRKKQQYIFSLNMLQFLSM